MLKGWFTLKTTFFYYTGPPHYNTIKAIIIFFDAVHTFVQHIHPWHPACESRGNQLTIMSL